MRLNTIQTDTIRLICWSTSPTDPILSKNKKILQNFGQLAFFLNLLFSAKKEIKYNKLK